MNVSSVGALRCSCPLCSFSIAAVEDMTRYIAAELGPKGHSVNSISPGPVQTRHTHAERHIQNAEIQQLVANLIHSCMN